MAGRKRTDPSSSQPTYRVELREHEEGCADVAIVRIPHREDDGAISQDVWTKRFETVEAARTILQVMMGQPDQWASWVRMAQILGSDFVAKLIEAEAIETLASEMITAGQDIAYGPHADRPRRDASTVRVFRIEKGVPRIVFSRDDRRFLILIFDTVSEVRRVWDWIRWQARSFQDWYLIGQAKGGAALAALILSSMFADEERAKSQGQCSVGSRPLRYWRPAGIVGKDSNGHRAD